MTKVNSSDKLSALEDKIQLLRAELHELIESRGDVGAPEIIEMSQTLDKVLVQYFKEKSFE